MIFTAVFLFPYGHQYLAGHSRNLVPVWPRMAGESNDTGLLSTERAVFGISLAPMIWKRAFVWAIQAAKTMDGVSFIPEMASPALPKKPDPPYRFGQPQSHLKSEVQPWVKRNRIKFYFTPSKASWLNRIECQFTALRKFALDNSDFESHQQMQAAIESYLKWRNGQRSIAVESWRQRKRKKHRNQCRNDRTD